MMKAACSERDSRVPVIIRIAGLPACALEPFGSPRCAKELQAVRGLLAELTDARSALADRIYVAVPGTDAALRRVLLAARRDCFNGRPFNPYRSKPEWTALREKSGALADRVVELEERLTAARGGMEAEHGRQREREREHLLAVLADRSLLRGIALASPVAVENLHRLRAVPPSRYGRKETRLQETFLRYVTRAACKLSPYSTLTRVGLGTLRDDLPPGTALLHGGEWEGRSLLRVKRYVLDQLWDLLRVYPPFREGLKAVLNETIEPVEGDRYRFLRPGGWDLEPTAGHFRFQPAALVKVSLDGPVVRWLLRELPHRRPTYGELRGFLDREIDPAAAPRGVRTTLDRLIQIGFVCLLPPWPAHASHLEADILRCLDTLPDPGLAPVTEVLRRLTGLEAGFPAAAEPARRAQEMDEAIDDLWVAASPLAGLEPGAQRSRLPTGNFYEDVFLHRASSSGELFQMSKQDVEEIRRSLSPVVRLQALYDRRHDFLLTLAAFMAERWPGRREVRILELFGEVQPLWQEYIRFTYAWRAAADALATFNPFGLAVLAGLRRLREEVWQQTARCVEPSSEGLRLRGNALAAAVAAIPEPLAATVGGCFFFQPVGLGCRHWVVNRIHEGTGRWGSRFTAVMDPEARRAYTDRFTARSWDERGDELLDITWPQGDTLNVHPAQTRRRLGLPGQRIGLPVSRRVSLTSLRVRRREEGLPPELVDGAGRRCRPVHLGGAGYDFVPTPLKILALFGAAEMQLLFPSWEESAGEGVRVRERLTLDNLILRRKRWRVETDKLLERLGPAGEAEAFEAINLWRLDRSIPDRVFVRERVHDRRRDDRYKPQYIDFTSPLLVEVFQSTLRHNREVLTFEELMPAPDLALRDARGRSWAVEILLDELAAQPLAPSAAVRTVSPCDSTASVSQAEPAWLTHTEEPYAEDQKGRAIGF
jgi:hypothetical protein